MWGIDPTATTGRGWPLACPLPTEGSGIRIVLCGSPNAGRSARYSMITSLPAASSWRTASSSRSRTRFHWASLRMRVLFKTSATRMRFVGSTLGEGGCGPGSAGPGFGPEDPDPYHHRPLASPALLPPGPQMADRMSETKRRARSGNAATLTTSASVSTCSRNSLNGGASFSWNSSTGSPFASRSRESC